MNIPFFDTDNKASERWGDVYDGDIVTCPCGHDHVLRSIADNSGVLFYDCGKRTYLAAINNKAIIYVKNTSEKPIDVSCRRQNERI